MGFSATKNQSGHAPRPQRGAALWNLFWYAIGALMLGALLAKWSWRLFATPATVVAAAPEHTVSESSGRLFGVVAAGTPSASNAAVMPEVKLIGVFAPDSGRSGFAVLQLDAQHQLGVAVGEEVSPGVSLSEVRADHVVLERAGVRQQVKLVNADEPLKGIEPAKQ